MTEGRKRGKKKRRGRYYDSQRHTTKQIQKQRDSEVDTKIPYRDGHEKHIDSYKRQTQRDNASRLTLAFSFPFQPIRLCPAYCG